MNEQSEQVFPRVTQINGMPREWSVGIKALWAERVAPLFKPGDSCSSANYAGPRPYKDEWNRGTNKAGFVYIVQPKDRVCFVEWTDSTPAERDDDDRERDFLLAAMLDTGTIRYVSHTVLREEVTRVSFIRDDRLIFALVVMVPEKNPRLARHRQCGLDSEVVDGPLTQKTIELAIRRWAHRNHLTKATTASLALELSDG